MACNWIDRYGYFSMPAAATFIVAMPRSFSASTTGRPICTVEFTRVVFGPSSCTSNICASCCASMSLMYSTLPCSVSVTVTVLLTVPISGLLDAETSVNCFDPISVAWRARSWLSISAESCAMSDCRNCEDRFSTPPGVTTCLHRKKKNWLHCWSDVCSVCEPVMLSTFAYAGTDEGATSIPVCDGWAVMVYTCWSAFNPGLILPLAQHHPAQCKNITPPTT